MKQLQKDEISLKQFYLLSSNLKDKTLARENGEFSEDRFFIMLFKKHFVVMSCPWWGVRLSFSRVCCSLFYTFLVFFKKLLLIIIKKKAREKTNSGRKTIEGNLPLKIQENVQSHSEEAENQSSKYRFNLILYIQFSVKTIFDYLLMFICTFMS